MMTTYSKKWGQALFVLQAWPTTKSYILASGTMHRAPTVEKIGKPTSNSIPTITRGF